ncbi:hypothetical protein QYQ99_04800 [Comamonas testosteroni]|uniref:hypothetical protein n=1 Tax=Comamonas testosteroni TaxID=285 RepID=UPI00265DAB5D|nr:hypothetical protein [Comamonas testosteroni]WKL16854.1 hypothetical protein QYQ99_04800 [Comamonas testosteroni]
MQNKLLRLAASVIVVTGLTACSSLSGMTDKVSQTWDKTWTGLTGKKQVQTQAAVKQTGLAPAGIKVSEDSGRWQGLYSLDGETARFQECESGQIIGVLPEGDSVLLEQAYLNTRSSATIAMLAEVQGRVVERPVADPVLARQGRKMLALRVERFVALSSQAACRNAKANW